VRKRQNEEWTLGTCPDRADGIGESDRKKLSFSGEGKCRQGSLLRDFIRGIGL
jgi:hypothetical protein